jgi:hypothetical protein
MGRTVVITTPIPEIKCEPGKMLIIKKLFGYTYNDFSRTPDEYLQLNHKLLIYFERLRYEKHVTIVDVSRGLLQNGYYTITLGDNVYYSDNNHLSLKGARLAAAPLAPLFYQ